MSEFILNIDEGGRVEFIATQGESACLQLEGAMTKRRASHVEPINPFVRLAFYALRVLGDETRAAGWTRRWGCLWRVRIIGGPTFGSYRSRQRAIAAEIDWLNRNRFGGTE
jgi:hypothetical protein